MELKLEKVSKQFGQKIAVDHLDLKLQNGIVGLLGANGSGKTTLIRMMTGLLKPTQGIIYFNGKDINKEYEAFVLQLGYMPQHLGFYPDFTVLNFLDYMATLKGLNETYAKQRIEYLLDRVNLSGKRKQKIKTLSGGMLRRLGIAQALLSEPSILILDEPTAGLDPKERILFRNLISEIGEHTLVLLSTHIVSDIESIADRILIMKEGSILADGTTEEILHVVEGKVWSVEASLEEVSIFEKNHTIVNRKRHENHVELRVVSDQPPASQAKLIKPDLDDVYLYFFEEEVEADV